MPEDALTRIANILEAAQFTNGSLDITLQGPESEWVGSPLVVKLFLMGEMAERISNELSGIGIALQAIADAIAGAAK